MVRNDYFEGIMGGLVIKDDFDNGEVWIHTCN